MGFLIWFLWSAARQIGLFHFTNDNTDSERLSSLCKFTQLVSGRVRICTFVFRPAYWIQCSPPRPKDSWLIVVETPSCLFLRGTEHFSKTNILLEESLWAGSWLETGSWRICADHGDESVKPMAWTWCIPLQMNYKTALLLVLNIKEKLNPFILPLQGKSPPQLLGCGLRKSRRHQPANLPLAVAEVHSNMCNPHDVR